MAMKRLLMENSAGNSGRPIKSNYRPSDSEALREIRSTRNMLENISSLEPMIRKIVQEGVKDALDSHLGRLPSHETECSPGLQLKFTNDLPNTLFTGNTILSVNKSPLMINLYDPFSRKIVTTGSLSSAKVNIVVLDGDFALDDSSGRNFDSKILRNREGKPQLLSGQQLVIPLQNGEGCIHKLSFTDNSKWTRSGKFRLGLKICKSSDEQVLVREGISNAFRVKYHRGESYQKHHPPSLNDDVWRLENIAPSGTYFKKLSDNKICYVRDLLQMYHVDEQTLRCVILRGFSGKKWQKMIEHAMTCDMDEKRYTYKTAYGILLFDSIYRLVKVSFDGRNYKSVESLNDQQKKLVEDLKKQAYKSFKETAPLPEASSDECSTLHFANPTANNLINMFSPSFGSDYINLHGEQDEPELRIRADPPNNYCLNQNNFSSFEFGESSTQFHGPVDPSFGYNFNTMNTPKESYTGCSFLGSQFSSELLNWQRDAPFLSFNSQDYVTNSSETIASKVRKSKTRWCKVVAVLKWRILFKAARRLNCF